MISVQTDAESMATSSIARLFFIGDDRNLILLYLDTFSACEYI